MKYSLFTIIKFHLINDLYGRVFGDTVLKSMAEGVRTVARAYGGVACRHNADSFYLYIEHQKDYDYLKKTILDKLGEVMNNINAKLRIGVYPDLYRSCTLQQLLRSEKHAFQYTFYSENRTNQ